MLEKIKQIILLAKQQRLAPMEEEIESFQDKLDDAESELQELYAFDATMHLIEGGKPQEIYQNQQEILIADQLIESYDNVIKQLRQNISKVADGYNRDAQLDRLLAGILNGKKALLAFRAQNPELSFPAAEKATFRANMNALEQKFNQLEQKYPGIEKECDVVMTKLDKVETPEQMKEIA